MDKTHIWYTVSLDGPQDEHPVTCEDAIQITHDYISCQKEYYETDAELIKDSRFGFCIDNKNYIEISIDSKSEFRILFEYQEEKSFVMFKWEETFSRECKTSQITTLDNIIHHFFSCDFDQFKSFFLSQILPDKSWANSNEI